MEAFQPKAGELLELQALLHLFVDVADHVSIPIGLLQHCRGIFQLFTLQVLLIQVHFVFHGLHVGLEFFQLFHMLVKALFKVGTLVLQDLFALHRILFELVVLHVQRFQNLELKTVRALRAQVFELDREVLVLVLHSVLAAVGVEDLVASLLDFLDPGRDALSYSLVQLIEELEPVRVLLQVRHLKRKTFVMLASFGLQSLYVFLHRQDLISGLHVQSQKFLRKLLDFSLIERGVPVLTFLAPCRIREEERFDFGERAFLFELNGAGSLLLYGRGLVVLSVP